MVLIVDDNPAFRRMIVRIVGDLVDEIRECEDGVGAVIAYRQFQPDLVLMDIEMEGGDGITATREIINSFPEARIIIVTQYDEPHWRKAAAEAGACDYVLKDNLYELRNRLRPPQT